MQCLLYTFSERGVRGVNVLILASSLRPHSELGALWMGWGGKASSFWGKKAYELTDSKQPQRPVWGV